MAVVGDPDESGFVASLARPGGNITGQSILSAELAGKRLELLRELIPGLRSIAVLSNPMNPAHVVQMKSTEAAVKALRMTHHAVEARSPEEIETAFQTIAATRAGALLVLDDAIFLTHRAQIANTALRSRLPAMFGLSGFAAVGGLLNYGPDVAQMWRRSATYVDKILRGTKPADLPIGQATTFQLAVNVKTAEALSLTIPQAILTRADEVIR
jgi:putative ABC transport system substrate-binding protein